MLEKQVLEILDTLDRPEGAVQELKELFANRRFSGVIEEKRITGKAETTFLKICIPGTDGKKAGGDAPTLGVIGQLGGLGASPSKTGLVSDGDGAVAALALALKMIEMKERGQALRGDVIISTHVCMSAPLFERKPVPFMGLPVDMVTMNKNLLDEDMDYVISVDTTKGNRILNHRGIAITPTVKKGYILKVSEELLDILVNVTGEMPYVLPITVQDITTYHNGLFHINSIMQPATLTDAPVIGLAITAASMVPGCATGASHSRDIEMAARFCLECAKALPDSSTLFHDELEYRQLVNRYGDLSFLTEIGE